MRDYNRDYYYERIENSRFDRCNRSIAASKKNKYYRFYNKRIIIMITLFIFIAVFTIFSVKKITYAKSSSVNMNKRYTSVMIYCGDTVATIASQNYGIGYSSENSYINDICNINNINRQTDLIPGNYLILPYYEVCTP